MAHFIVTGSSTGSGQPLYLVAAPNQAGQGWKPTFTEAAVLSDRQTAERVVAEHKRQSQAIVCDPYIVEVRVDGNAIKPLSLRESIRADGPTVPYA